MKRRFASLFLIAVLLCTAFAAVFVGCNTAGVSYSVTVVMPDGSTPVQGATVSWEQDGKSKGSAVTGADGKATAELASGTYDIRLSGIEAGLSYTSVKVTSGMRDLRLRLSRDKVNYVAKVFDKDGNPAKGVTVAWMSGAVIVEQKNTDDNGTVTVELDYGDYNVSVTDNLPDGNTFNGTLSATGENPEVNFYLTGGASIAYKITVMTEGGLKYDKIALGVYEGSTYVYAGSTNQDGEFSFKLKSGTYRVEAELPEGYTCEPLTLNENENEGTIIMRSSVISGLPDANKKYVIGDIINDFKFTTPYNVNGDSPMTYSIAELLKTKEVVIINNWGINCTWCVREMPAMQEVYQQYKDKIEIIAVDNYSGGDSDSSIISFREQNGLTFPMMRDKVTSAKQWEFASHFDIKGWPTTIIVDRYGAIARIESGAITTTDAWSRLIKKYIGDNYVQEFVPGSTESGSINDEISKPDIELDDDHYEKLGAAINNVEGGSVVWYGETEDDTVWPFIFGKVEGVSPDKDVMYCSNSTKPNSWSAIYATVNIEAGKVFTFEYYADTEDGSDVMSFIWDNKIVRTITGSSDGWQTCHLYSDIAGGAHSLAIAYIKDSSGNIGKDNVFIRNVHFEELSMLENDTNMLRCAGYGVGEIGSNYFPYYANVRIESDGYYHVVLSDLQNSATAGNDPSPMLFANLMGATPWHKLSIYELAIQTSDITGEYKYSCNFTIGGVSKDWRSDIIYYAYLASCSDLKGYVPVDKELHDLLVAFMARVSGSASHANEWLEISFFYSHYGEGEPIGNPIIGLSEKTAIVANLGTQTAELTRVMQPFATLIYSFTPTESAVYHFQSLVPASQSSKYATQITIYDVFDTDNDYITFCGDNYVTRDGKNEHNFSAYVYMTAGHTYYLQVAFQQAESGVFDFKIEKIGQSVDVEMPASWNYYYGTGDILAGAIEYEKDEDGYYHALNADGTMGDFIYFDVKYPNLVGSYTPVQTLVDMYVKDPADRRVNLDFKIFDFTHIVVYTTKQTIDEETGDTVYYSTREIVDISSLDAKYKDYTDIMKGYVEQAMANTGDMQGLVKVDQQLVDILKLYFELRNNSINTNANGAILIEPALDNEWLRFCWYKKHYDVNNVA